MTTVWIIIIVAALAFACVAIIGIRPPGGRSRPTRDRRREAHQDRPRRILFPFVASALSSNALESSLRLAHAEGATLVPVFLERVPMNLPLEAPLPKQSESALMLLETIEQRAAAHKVPVDARVQRGRDNRHALRQAIEALPQGYRTVFVMHDIEGFTHEEIGVALGVETGTSMMCDPKIGATGPPMASPQKIWLSGK